MPGIDLESLGVVVDIPGTGADDIYEAFLSAAVPVVGAVSEGRYVVDFFTVGDGELKDLAAAAGTVIARFRGNE